MILPDSSAWIEGFRGTGSPAHQALDRLLRARAEIVVTEPVIFEVFAGVRTRKELDLARARLLAFPVVGVGGLATYERAAALYRRCRAAGEEIRSGMDCVIAAVAIREGASLLHQDRDFDVIAKHAPLAIEPVG